VAAGPRLRFQADQRLRRPAEFQRVYSGGRRFGNALLTAAVHTSQLSHARLGLSIAARTIGNAVQRNRLRRQIRDSFRLQQQALPPVDIVIGARVAARNASGAELRASLLQLWEQIATQCAR